MLRSSQLGKTEQTRPLLIINGTQNLTVKFGTITYLKGRMATLPTFQRRLCDSVNVTSITGNLRV